MKGPAIQSNDRPSLRTFAAEPLRLEILSDYGVLDTAPVQALDDLVQLAAKICETPIALISLIDEERQWFKARVGLESQELPRNISFCTHTLQQEELFIVPDATRDQRFATNPLVTGELALRYYMGAPLVTPEGAVLGTLCVIDRSHREMSSFQEETLVVLAQQTMAQFELLRQKRVLLESELLSRTVVESALDAIVTVDHNNRITEFNSAAEKTFGFARAAVLGRNMSDVLIPERLREAHRLSMGQYLKTGQSHLMDRRVELTALRADGSEFPVELTIRKLGELEPPRFTAFLRDITERRRAEAILLGSIERFQTVARATNDAIWDWNFETDFLWWNEGYQTLFGYAEEAAPPTSGAWAELIHPDDRERILKSRQQLMEGGDRRWTGEYRYLRQDGTYAEILDRCEVLRGGNGTTVRVIGAMQDITERKHAQLALQQSQDDLELTLDAARMGTWDFNLVTGETTVSPQCLAIHGLSNDKAVKVPEFLDSLHPEDRPRIEASFHRAIEERSLYNEQKRVIWPDGSIHWTASRAQVYCDAAGEPVRMAGVTFDITPQKLAEEQLAASEQRYRVLFEHAPDGIVIADPQGIYLDANLSMCRMLGYPCVELVGLGAESIVAVTERAHLSSALLEIKEGGKYNREWQMRRKDGSHFSAEVNATLMPDGNLLAIIRDITERKRIEERFRRLVDSNAQGVAFWNLGGEITEANDAFLEIIGFTRENLQDPPLRWDIMLLPEYANQDDFAREELLTKGVCRPYEKELQRKDGSRVPVLLGAALFRESPNDGVCFVVDITERKKLEQQFLRAQRVENIGTLAGGIAHDLNNVLSPIILSLDLLKIRFTDASSRDLLAIIRASAQRGADMVSQVLSYARGMDGRRVEVRMEVIIEEIVKIAQDTFLKHIEVRTKIPRDLRPAIGDPTHLHQVLLNLCVNARDAMPDGGTLTISAGNITHHALDREVKPGNYVFLQVEDNGTGIAPKVLDKIFDPFFTTKEIGNGTGLGLSTSLAIVKSHGGYIRCYSEVGKGTKFVFAIPAQAETPMPDAVADDPNMPSGNGEWILVVDDEPSVREIIRQTLEACGYQVLLACDGAEAISIYGSHVDEIAAVITDMTMPVMDGPATIRALREMNPNVRVITSSGLAANHHAGAAELGIRHFLPKPFSVETLLTTLHQVLHPD